MVMGVNLGILAYGDGRQFRYFGGLKIGIKDDCGGVSSDRRAMERYRTGDK